MSGDKYGFFEKIKENDGHYLYNGNCLELVKTIPDESIDLTVTSPPYFMGKEYDKSVSIEDFINFHKVLLPEIIRITKPGRSICWQIGYHISSSVVYPLDFYIYDILKDIDEVRLRNRIIWTFGHGLHGKRKFSGRHETILWFTKGDEYYFDLDSVRIPQKYPGKKYYRGEKKGEFSGNPLGKNPSDVWEIPNVKANHIEKTEHPCQFPISLVQRLILSLTPEEGIVFDPFMGSGTSCVAAFLKKRLFVGAELDNKYIDIAINRIKEAKVGKLKYRPLDKPVFYPSNTLSVAKKPEHFK